MAKVVMTMEKKPKTEHSESAGEITPADAQPAASAPPAAGGKGKAKVKLAKADVSEMDAALEKMHQKVQQNYSSPALVAPPAPSGPRPWEIDPSKLTLKHLLGKGTYGTVHRGTYEGKEVAIKMLEWGDQATMLPNEIDGHRAQFIQEVEIMYRLNHPNITSFVGATKGGTDLVLPSYHLGSQCTYNLKASTCCVVMEYVSGGTIRALWINNRRAGRRRLGFNVVYQIALDTARGLAYLHSEKICHRDLKPDNLLLDKDMRVKIADFGIARVEAAHPGDMSMRTGTMGYMAPEVLDGCGYDHKCDVFSYAICVWEIYCCDFPYPDMGFGDMVVTIVKKQSRPYIPPCCPTILKKVMQRCWHPKPERRPEMSEVVQWLEEFDPSKGAAFRATQGAVEAVCLGCTGC